MDPEPERVGTCWHKHLPQLHNDGACHLRVCQTDGIEGEEARVFSVQLLDGQVWNSVSSRRISSTPLQMPASPRTSMLW